jgi:diguanylate cyclase (GGDEF)-like protein
VSLVLVDLDRFKRVNDTWGHQAGDAVLREVARRLQASARRGDLAARVGGEELAWLLPETGVDAARDAAERLRRAIRDIPIPPVGTMTASLGVAELGPGGPDDLVRRADAALYRAKEGGRDACVAAEDPVTASPSG